MKDPTEHSEERDEADSRLMDALLALVLRPDPAGREERIQRVMASLEASPTPAQAQTARSRWPSRVPRRWISLALAGGVLAMIAWWIQSASPSQRAQAMVLQSLAVVRSSGCREYRMTAVIQHPVLGQREVVSQLFVDGEQDFALRHPPIFPLGVIWIGKNDRQAWVVPERGPVLVGDQQRVERWLADRKAVTTPLLHLPTVLQRMAERYVLEPLEDTVWQAAGSDDRRRCRRVLGQLSEAQPAAPQTVELWADAETGSVCRLILSWHRAAETPGPIQITVELLGQPKVPADWFEHTGHHGPERRVISLESDRIPVPARAPRDNIP